MRVSGEMGSGCNRGSVPRFLFGAPVKVRGNTREVMVVKLQRGLMVEAVFVSFSGR